MLHRLLFLIFTTFNLVICQDLTNVTVNDEFGRAIKCKRDDGTAQRCMPVIENIAFGRDIKANNTCGLNGPQQYCVQTGVSGAVKICEDCDASDPGKSHPGHLMTDVNFDDNPTWWQSETIYTNKYPVHLILKLHKTYNVAFIRLRFHSVRPHSFAIYKKSTYDENEEWLPYQFYSQTCLDTYGLPNREVVKPSNQKIALCTDEASGETPLSGGNVAYLTLDHRPGKNDFDNHPSLQDWVTVTALRFNLDRVNTFGDEVFGDPKVLKSYYFAISDITVGGRCKCNGHGSSCNNNNDAGIFKCVCEHYTHGSDCEKCLPLFNDRPWRRASGRSANPCQECNCNELADECVFDQQMWVDSNFRSGGRCINCKNNTDGPNCERCKRYHYRSNKAEACKPCGCNQIGSRSLSCNDKGECLCHSGVAGVKCDKCKDGYFGLSSTGCRPCNCDKEGSLGKNCDATGQCECKENTVGKRCDRCDVKTFDLDESNPKGCKECFCYGHGVSCTAAVGIGAKEIVSTFEVDSERWKLEDEFGNDYSSNLGWDDRGSYLLTNPVSNKQLYLVAPKRYLGNKLSSYAKLLSFSYGIFRYQSDPAIIPGTSDLILEGDSLKASFPINYKDNVIPEARFDDYKYRLIEPEGVPTFDFQRLLSNLTAIKIRTTYLKDRKGAIDNIRMQSTQYISENSPEQVTWKEKCECQDGYTGDQCEKCDSGFTRDSQEGGPIGMCKKCFCNNHGSSCNPETGKCQCEHNTRGDNCQQCEVGYYGNPTAGTPNDCKRCPCLYGTECIELTSGVRCTKCPDGHIGDFCEICDDGYFGDPKGELGLKTSCQKCDCNGNIDPNAVGNCNSLTGACLKCINNTQNGPENNCELCEDGYYGDATIEPKGNCTACDCFANGTVIPPDHKPGEPLSCDSNGTCTCLPNVIGKKCDMCPPGYWNVASGKGCERCNCNTAGSLSTNCDLETGHCECKKGVGGRTCDQCAPGHFRFSLNGCEACNCHPDGSKHQNCTQFGVCECLPGVLGIKCDQCPESKYNLSAGCIACPKCFNLIQVAVDKLRYKLKTFNITGNLTDRTIDVKDANFEKLIRQLQKSIDKLRKMIDELLAGDKSLSDFFEKLVERFEKLSKQIRGLQRMIEKSTGATKTGQNEITSAEETIDMITNLLEEAEMMLKAEVEKILKAAESNRGDVSGLAKRMRAIAEEARKLANKHVSESTVIKSNADMAYNNSEAAYNTSKDARNKEEEINEKLKNMVIDATKAKSLAEESRVIIENAENVSGKAIKEADKLLDKAKEPLPSLDIAAIRAKALNIANESGKIKNDSVEIVFTNDEKVVQLGKDDAEARELMKRGAKLQNASNEMYDIAKKANDEAKAAQEDGLKVAKDAQEMLETLQGFEKIINESKANATEALKNIELIKGLIKEANETTTDASFNADMASSDANKARDLAQKANATTQMAKEEIDSIRKEAERLLNETMQFMMNEVVQTKNDTIDVKNDLERHAKQTEENSRKLAAALNDSKEATDLATTVENELLKSAENIEVLMEAIDALEEIDFPTLEDAEERFNNAKNTIEIVLQREIENLESKLTQQENLIMQYELSLAPLRKKIAFNRKIYDYIPKGCYREPPAPENVQLES